MLRVILVTLSLLCTLTACHTAVGLVQNDLSYYRAESACVREYIQVGVERSDIVTHNGTCYLK